MKKGVTLMALALTITIMFTLLGLVIPQSYRTTTQAKLASFAMDIKQIEEALAVSVYNNDKGPIGKEVTREEVINSLTEEKANAIINEFNINSDVDTKVFNILDINKLQITNKDKYKINGNLPNAFVLSKSTSKVYYVPGISLDKKYYFSLTKDLLNKVESLPKISIMKEEELENLDLTNKMYVEKLTNAYTNDEMQIKIVTEKTKDSKIFLNIGSKQRDITEKIINDVFTLKYGEDAITKEDLLNVKEIIIQKNIGEKVTDVKKVNVENFDLVAPKIEKYTQTIKNGIHSIEFESTDNKGNNLIKYIVYSEKVGSDKLPSKKEEQIDYIVKNGIEISGNKVEIKDDWIKFGIVAIDSAGNASSPYIHNLFNIVNKPADIKSEQNNYYPIAYNNGKWMVVSNLNRDNEWYNYSENSKKWANIICVSKDIKYKIGQEIDESIVKDWFVWVPRFAYSINKYKTEIDNSEGTTTDIFDISFLVNKTDMDIEGNKYLKDYNEELVKVGEKTPKIVHPAFNFAGKELTGIWVSKFNNTEDKFNQTETRKDSGYNINQTFNKYSTLKDKTLLGDKHAIKNTEWGAVAYLTASKYGFIPSFHNSRVTTFKDGLYKKEVKLSNTGNVYGIYELNGGLSEIVMAAFEWNQEAFQKELGQSLEGSFEKYVDRYTTPTKVGKENKEIIKETIELFKSKKGDAMYEVMADDQFEIAKDENGNFEKPEEFIKELGLYNGDAVRFSLYSPFLKRGGSYEDGTKSGIFSISSFEYSNIDVHKANRRDKNGGRRYILIEGKYN